MDRFSGAWKGILQCQGCSTKSNVFRRKKPCFSCKKNFCPVCLIRRPDQQMYCRKCQILTATPLDKNELLNLRSRDLVNYLTSRHISTSGCVEKEDLVNVLMRAVNSSSSSSTHSINNSGSNSFSNSPFRGPVNTSANFRSDGNSQGLRSEEFFNDDGIRIIGTGVHENEGSSSSSNHSSNSEALNESDWVVVNGSNAESGESAERGNGDRGSNTAEYEDRRPVTNETRGMTTATPTTAMPATETPMTETPTTARVERTTKTLKLSDISCFEDLDNLSVKELKTLLMMNRTDFKGCVERAELIEKASRLWSDYTLSRRDLEKLSLEELCKICMDAPIECVLLECGHMATCMSCGKQLAECPVCRQYVVRCVRTFKV